MADDFDAAGISRWSTTARTSSSITSFEGSAAIAAESASCSAANADVGSSISGPLIDSSPPLQVPGFGMDWSQSLLSSSSSSGGRAHEPSFHAMLQESLSCPQVQTQDQFLIDHGQQQPGLSMMLQGLFETEVKPQTQQSIFDQRPLNYQPSPTMTMMGTSNFSQFLKSSPPKQQASVCSSGHLQFSNNTTFWNASAGAASEARSGFYPSMMPVQFGSSTTATSQSYEQKPSCSSLTTITTTKSSSDSVQKRSSSGGSNPALKKSRIEAPSPLPTFKVRGLDLMVRKEKLGDRITALQQLVSPFGKTDTASVLHEAIEYIKFLHDQVSVLSTPYLKNGHPMQHQQSSDKSKDGEGPKQDLRSRGLCLVPIESTYPVASETTADFWTLTFGGSYR